MKRTFVIILFTILFHTTGKTYGQITYEQSYPTYSWPTYGPFFITDIGDNNFKYILYRCDLDQFSIYNLDHSPYMLNIQIPVTSDSCTHHSIGYITSSLFDCDSSTIEYALLPENPNYSFKIFRTDGTLLFNKDSVYGYWCYGCQEASVEIKTIVNTNEGTKMYLHSPWSDPDSVLIYSLCGTLPLSIEESDRQETLVKVYPNPTTNQVNFEILSDDKQREYELTIFNANFQEIRKDRIGRKTLIDFDGQTTNSGIYFYTIQTGQKVLQTGKFVMSK